MWKQWASGVLGILIIILPYLSFPWGAHKVAMVVLGLAVAVLSFWSASEESKRQV